MIQKRLLSKTAAAQTTLAAVYRDQADILKNQLSFSHVGMTFKPYADALDFVSVYPFAPYQFQLVQKVFEAIRRHGVTGLHLARGERSMLDAFQSAAVQLSGAAVGVLVPLHRFYPAIESFLEGIVKSTIDHAAGNDKLDPFDVLVLKTLFLIRYVDEIRGSLDNLVTLFIDRIDADRLGLRHQIEASLQRLEKETLIGRNGEDFFFLTNESATSAANQGCDRTRGRAKSWGASRDAQSSANTASPITTRTSASTACATAPSRRRTEAIWCVLDPLADDTPHNDGKCTLQRPPRAPLILVGRYKSLGDCAPPATEKRRPQAPRHDHGQDPRERQKNRERRQRLSATELASRYPPVSRSTQRTAATAGPSPNT